jgi:phospholipid/cholesterol/gamma-HCH transport system permease protein
MFSAVGRWTIAGARFVGGSTLLLAEAGSYLFRGKVRVLLTLRHMAQVGFDSLPIACLTLLFGGMVLSLHTVKLFVRFGASEYVGGMVGVSIARELGPVLTSVVVAARVGSAMAAELGTMKVTEQIDALRSMATSPAQYLVLPRVLATAFALPLLTLYTEACGVVGALVVAAWQGVAAREFFGSMARFLEPSDFFGGLLKTVVFGAIVALVGCRQGLQASGGAAGVGRATTSSVVISISLIYGSNYLLSWLILTVWP